jgi:hypothetical protein
LHGQAAAEKNIEDDPPTVGFFLSPSFFFVHVSKFKNVVKSFKVEAIASWYVSRR